MTALKGYQRLECPGVWRASPEHQRKNVIVSVGATTLVMYDYADRPLTHWSLPAVVRLNGDARPAVFTPGTDSTEQLEIGDDSMIDSIERVQRVVERRRPRNRRPPLSLISVTLCVLFIVCILWLPELLTTRSAAVVPVAKRTEIGERLLSQIQRTSGHPCDAPSGTEALNRLYTRLLGGRKGRLVVLPNGIAQSNHLPGGLILVDPALIENQNSPDVVAGYVVAEAVRADGHDPIAGMLEQAGPLAALRLLTTGDVTEDMLNAQAAVLLSQQPEPVGLGALLERFREAGLSPIPYAIAANGYDEVIQGTVQLHQGGESPVLSDADWVSLQRICER